MAGIAYSRKRLYNPDLIVDPNGVLPQNLALDVDGRNKTLYEITWTGTSQAGEELGTAPDSAKDGTTTPYIVTMVSSDVADDRGTAAGAVHSVALIGVTTSSVEDYLEWKRDPTCSAGIRGKPQSTVEVVAMDGTTDVLATRYFIWLDGLYACEWGTGATDATGNITAESPANTALLTIAATYNESNGGRFHFPPGKKAQLHHVDITPLEVLAATTGVIVDFAWTGNDQTNNTDPDLNVDYYTYITPSNTISLHEQGQARYTTTNTTVIISETTVNAAKDFHLHAMLHL